VDQVFLPNTLQRVTTERNFTDVSPARSTWRVSSAGSPYVVQVSRNPEDGAAGDPPALPGAFPIADGWVLVNNPSEIDDGAALGSNECPAGLNAFDDNQSVDGADVVLWVRAAALHQGEAGGEAQDCSMVGPTIRVLPAPVPVATSFHTLTACRIVDTRDAPGPYGSPALAANSTRTFVLAGQCGIPPTARSVAANVTAVQASSTGHLTFFRGGSAVPSTSTLNFRAGLTRANNTILPLGASGDVSAQSVMPSGIVHLIIDVTGWFE
jgi:hypothetical protein